MDWFLYDRDYRHERVKVKVYSYHHMPEEIYIEQKKERVGDVFFGMTSFYAKKSEKIKLVGEDKKSESLRLLQMFLNYVLQ